MKYLPMIVAAFGMMVATSASAQCGGSNKTSNHHAQNTSHAHEGDLVDVADDNGDFSTLVTALKVAGLVGTLQGEGPFTVFAPSNAAFAKLDDATLKSLLLPENKKTLQTILTYHVVSGNFMAKDVINAVNASGGEYVIETVSGGKLKVTVDNGIVLLKDEQGGVSAVTATDVPASNGTIHVIDSVVLPS